MKKLRVLLCALSLVLPVLARAQAGVRRDLIEMSEQIERRLKYQVDSFMGPDSRSLVSVYVGEPKSAEAKSAPNAAPSDKDWMILGYGGVPSAPENARAPETSVGNVEITIQLEKGADPAQVRAIEQIARRVVRGLEAKVVVNDSLEPKVAKSSEDKNDRAPASDTAPASMGDRFKQYPGLFTVLGAALLFLSVLFVGWAFRSSITRLGEELKSLRLVMSPNAAPATPKVAAPALPEPEQTKLRALPPPPRVLEHRRNLDTVHRTVTTTPLALTRSLGDSPEDMLGLKYLITQLPFETRAQLREVLGMERILQVDAYQPEGEIVSFDAAGWLQKLVERIELRKLKGGGLVEDVLSTEQILLLSEADPEHLFEEGLRGRSPALWRLVTDFLSPEFLKSKTRDFDESLWNLLLEGAASEDQEAIRASVDALVAKLRASVSERGVGHKFDQEKKDYFTKRLLPAIVDSVLSKGFGDDDRLLDSIIAKAPHYAAMLRASIWTPSALDQVEVADLKASFSRLDNERKARLIFILPKAQAERLHSFLAVGMGQQVVDDMVRKLGKTVSDDEKESIVAFAREFLDHLRARSLRGEIKLVAQAQQAAISMRKPDAEILDKDDGREVA